MLYYPQLATGAIAGYPLTRKVMRRTVLNRMADGSALKLADADAASVQWTLPYTGLSDVERESLESFFAACEGRLKSFTFFDPAGNLLAHSEDLTKSAWQVEGLIQVDGMKLTNGSQVWRGITQTVAAPQWFVWCFSALVRGSGRVRTRIGSLMSEHAISEDWREVWCSGSIDGGAEEITCRLNIQPGYAVEIAKLRLQAQPLPGEYRRTAQYSGAFPETRFDQDRLEFTAEGPDNHSTTIRLTSHLRG